MVGWLVGYLKFHPLEILPWMIPEIWTIPQSRDHTDGGDF
jgi:hypothetical protein